MCIFISLVWVKVLCSADDIKHLKHVACEDFSLRYRLPERETGTHFSVISINSYLSCTIGIKGMCLSRRDSKVSLFVFLLLLLRECFGYKYSKTWNFNNTNKGFITVHNSFKKLSGHNDRHSHTKGLDKKPMACFIHEAFHHPVISIQGATVLNQS